MIASQLLSLKAIVAKALNHRGCSLFFAESDKRGLITDCKQVEEVLSQYWVKKIAVVWTTEDVFDVLEESDRSSEITKKQAKKVLLMALEKHDAENGITWDTLRYWIDEV